MARIGQKQHTKAFLGNGWRYMPLIEWSDKLSVGIEAVDADHRKLFALVSYLYDSMVSGKGHKVIAEFLDALIVYTREHFQREEALFEASAYPNVDAHRAEHEALIKQIVDVQAKYASGTTSTLTLEVIGFLNKWLVDHIEASDKRYAPHVQAKGVK